MHGRDSKAAVRLAVRGAGASKLWGGLLSAQPGCSPCSNVGDAPFHASWLGSVAGSQSANCSWLGASTNGTGPPCAASRVKARDVEPDQSVLCKPAADAGADAASASGPRLEAVGGREWSVADQPRS